MSNLDFTQVELRKIITHQIGNKLRDEGYQLSNEESIIQNESKNHLLKYFFSSAKADEFYSFSHAVNIEMNEINSVVKTMFSDSESFVQCSQNIAKLLYEQSMHPKVKEGQLNVTYFTNAIIDDEITDVIGIFKSETSTPFIQMKRHDTRFDIIHEFGFDIKEMDKGCLIFNTESQRGYKIIIIDRYNKFVEAQYWKDDFLNIKPFKNEFHQTNQFLGIAKQFVTKQLTEDFEITKADQIDYLNRSVDYFKSNDKFDKKDFEKIVFEKNSVIESFRKFDQNYREKNDLVLSDNFEISSPAVKKQTRMFKSVLKLDKNFHIYIHGNKEFIEQGKDVNGRKYYKIYYEHES
jgi:hypothetical protein